MADSASRGIKIQVETEYVEGESSPENHRFLFTYHVSISNLGDKAAQLVARHWIITDANGKTEEVRGPGVVGLKPLIKPGETFTYSSYCPFETPVGSMHGTYRMV